MEIRCIHTGDLHLGMEFRNASFDTKQGKKRRMELWKTFDRIIDRGIRNHTHFLFFAGDLFEEDYFTLGDIKRVADSFKKAKKTKIIIVAGNHDPLGDKGLYSLIKWPDNVYIFQSKGIETIHFEDLNTVIWGISWDKKEEKRRLLKDIKVEDKRKINILLVHGDALNHESKYLPIDRKTLRDKGFDYVALGHIHKAEFLDKSIAYCGSPEPLDFGETGIHGIIEGTLSKDKVKMVLEPFNLRSFKIMEVTIHPEMSYQDILDEVGHCDTEESRHRDLYRILLKGYRDRDLFIKNEEIIESLRHQFYYIELWDESIPDYDLDKLKEENEGNIIAIFIEEMEKKGIDDSVTKEALYYGLETLLKEKME